MNDFQFVDIIFFAMVAAFLVLRLRSVLGRRTGQERPPGSRPDGDNVVALPERRGPAPSFEAPPGSEIAQNLALIQNADPSFTPDSFMGGARAAFGMIVAAYAAGDAPALRPLLSDEVFRNFSTAIDTRRTAGETLDTEVVKLKSMDVTEARMDGSNALVTVTFVSDQVNVVRDAQGHVVDGDPSRIAEVTDIWTFARDTRAKDPNWLLVATRIPDEA
jgi:predicted lipid-binding transport protein (Tim44 family)